jgi:integrase
MENSPAFPVALTTENRTVPRRPANAELRTREHLTADEVERLIDAAKGNRHGQRDALAILLAYRHGLRAAEVVDLRWEQIDFKAADAARPQGEEWHAQLVILSLVGSLDFAPASAGFASFAVCVCLGERSTANGRRLLKDDSAGDQSARSYATPRLRLCPGECGCRYAGAASLSGPPQHPEYGALFGASTGSVQGILARLTRDQ